jgi:hypothetical protein
METNDLSDARRAAQEAAAQAERVAVDRMNAERAREERVAAERALEARRAVSDPYLATALNLFG